ncbi:unnamed protein product [Fraxinus pennsylvanica]|uniref:Uncharacterized protein n=1 Tax=Fraxinus pennsylvanica TaxID=56036 RepID=A0AAD2A925_9LAMI|nr:unnamed protein product [Fraxinus pennsylvanica]
MGCYCITDQKVNGNGNFERLQATGPKFELNQTWAFHTDDSSSCSSLQTDHPAYNSVPAYYKKMSKGTKAQYWLPGLIGATGRSYSKDRTYGCGIPIVDYTSKPINRRYGF